MILVDANLLIYAHVSSFPQHVRARDWLDAQLSASAPVGLPWPSLLGFLRIVTNPRAFEQPESIAQAWGQVGAWLEADVVWVPQPTERHREVLGSLFSTAGIQANLVPDAHLAALAIEHGLLLCSTDGDFARFPEVRWQDPLAVTRSSA
jgi:toxin-antitoxin system PIN domain toxin